jgi:hypothetical protein
VNADSTRSTADLTTDERNRLHRAHERLRAASQQLEGLVHTEPVRGRWEPDATPAPVLEASQADLQRAYEEVLRCHEELLGS